MHSAPTAHRYTIVIRDLDHGLASVMGIQVSLTRGLEVLAVVLQSTTRSILPRYRQRNAAGMFVAALARLMEGQGLGPTSHLVASQQTVIAFSIRTKTAPLLLMQIARGIVNC